MSILWSGIKFLGLLFVLALVVNTIIRAVVTTLIADVFYRARLKREPSLSRITLGEPLGLPVAAFLTCLVAAKGLAWLRLGRYSYVGLFACLTLYAVLSYGNRLYSSMPRSTKGFAAELVVYALFLANAAFPSSA